MTSLSDSRLILGGYFTGAIDGTAVNSPAVLLGGDGSKEPSFELRAVKQSVGMLELTETGQLLVGVPGALFRTENALESVPAVVVSPISRTVPLGESATLSVEASGQLLSYQWRKNGANLPGGTGMSLALGPVTQADIGRYDVVVSNFSGSITSAAAIVSVTSGTPTVVGRHGANRRSYRPGGSVTINNLVSYTGSLDVLGWQVLLPEGWSFASDSGGAGQVGPEAGDTALAEWAWTSIPASPFRFSYTLDVVEGTEGELALAALIESRQSGEVAQSLATPDPLLIRPIRIHSADMNGDNMIDLPELLRVIELYNTREGTQRTGQYGDSDSTDDGFVPGPPDPGRILRYHHADFDGDGQINLPELLRVIELYNTREGTRRTGRYRVQAGTADWFAPGE